MATPNFASPENASKYYVVLVPYEHEGEHVEPTEFDYDDLKDNLGYEIEQHIKGGCSTDEPYSNFDRSYHRQVIAHINRDKHYGDVCIELQFSVIVQSAYYQGATLDYIVEINNGYEYCNLKETDLDDIIEDLMYSSDMNKGMQKIQAQNIESWVEQTKTDISEQLEKLFEQHSCVKLACAGRFSNGEAVYSVID